MNAPTMNVANGSERQAAVEAWLAAAGRGEHLTGAALAEQFGRSDGWGRARVREARRPASGGRNATVTAAASSPVPGATGKRVEPNGRNGTVTGLPDHTDDPRLAVPAATGERAEASQRNQTVTGTPEAAGGADDPVGLSALILVSMAAAMAWSWDHLAHVAGLAGAGVGPFGLPMKWLLPISVDVLLIASAWKTRRLAAIGRRPGNATYTALIGSAFMSLAGNVIGTLDQAGIIPPIDQWDPRAAVAVVVVVGLWMPSAAILGLEVLRDRGRPTTAPPPQRWPVPAQTP